MSTVLVKDSERKDGRFRHNCHRSHEQTPIILIVTVAKKVVYCLVKVHVKGSSQSIKTEPTAPICIV